MKRKIAALVLCMLLVFQLSSPTASADRTVYFTAINDSVLPLADDTMPFWSGGFLYIPATIFTGDVWKELDVGYVYDAARALLVMHRGSDQALRFDLTKPYAQDDDRNTYYPAALLRGGVPFVPASLIAEFFDLTYSVTTVDQGYLVWLRAPDSVLQDTIFADAAKSQLRSRYDQYLKSKEPAPEPDTPEALPPEETFDGKSIYLCLTADDPKRTAELLDVLDRQDSQAAFFCTAEFLETQGDLLRRMTATGQAVGILVDGGDTQRSPLEQVRAGNQVLYQATCGMTRLALLHGAAGTAAQELEQTGYRLLRPDLDRSAFELKSASNARALFQRVTARRGNVSVWLGDSVSSTGLRSFLSAAKNAEDRCLAWTETAS